MAKKEEKNPVGRPKLADSELIKDSWCKIAASLVIVFVLTICGVGVLTARTPLQVLTFQNTNKLQGSVAKTITYRKVIPASKVKVIKAVREITGLGLKEAKEAVDGAPKVIKEQADKAIAEDAKAKLEAEGAKVTLK